jgi:hypothetical protein
MTQAAFFEQTPTSFLQGLFEESSTQKQRIGMIRRLADGREFVYGKCGTSNIAVGLLCVGTATDVANHGNLAAAVANIGDQSITITLGNLLATANMYAEGFLYINANTGEGYSYKIKSHPAASANANIVVTLYDPIRLATASGANATLSRHPAGLVVVSPSPPVSPVVGVTVIPVTANYFAWFQKKGPCPVLTEGTVVVSQEVFPAGGSNNGAVIPSSGNAIDMIKLKKIGNVLVVNADTEYSFIDLCIP